MRIIIDASSFIHFLAVGEQNILVQWAGKLSAQLCVPETVSREISRGVDVENGIPKFRRSGAHRRWVNLTKRVVVLSDAAEDNPELIRSMSQLHDSEFQYGLTLEDRLQEERDLGEFMAAAHALTLARRGHNVIVVCDDRWGRGLVKHSQRILALSGEDLRSIRLTDTRGLIEKAMPAWRKTGRSARETIAAIEKYESLPDWG